MLSNFNSFLNDNTIYAPEDIETVMKLVRPNFRFSWCNKEQRYFNVPCAFDIETTSTYINGEKAAFMYAWTFCLYGLTIIGRTWGQFFTMLDWIVSELNLNEHNRLLCGVHNLSFEFQFIRKWMKWKNVFAIDSRKPIYALSDTGIEFRCTYLLSGYSLEKVGEHLINYPVKKLRGDLDYKLIRHSETPLTEKELGYIRNDGKVCAAYIAECALHDGGIAKIPLTKTGYVRNFCRDTCFYDHTIPREKDKTRQRYKELINGLTLDIDAYKQQERAFQGGFTHANAFVARKVVYDGESRDFCSSYIASMIGFDRYPMSAPELMPHITKEEFYEDIKYYACIFDVEFVGLEPIVTYEHYISESRCFVKEGISVDNGRIISADRIETTITEIDFEIIQKMYKWEKFRVYNFRRYRRGYLPTRFVQAVLEKYKAKTELKGEVGKETEYMRAKEDCNSSFGMCVMSVLREQFPYTDHWLENFEKPKIDEEKEINKYNRNAGRFLYYAWGVYITAISRRNLFSAIWELGVDYWYSDTDSVKGKLKNHLEYFERYNEWITKKLKAACDYHGFSYDMIMPKTIKGVKKPLGIWEFDGVYKAFKTCGAKRYMLLYSDDERNGEKAGEFSMTISGVNKTVAIPYFAKGLSCNVKTRKIENLPFDKFDDGMIIPAGETGKLTHTHIDCEQRGQITDYLGNKAEYYEKSAVHLDDAAYSMGMDNEFLSYILDISEV